MAYNHIAFNFIFVAAKELLTSLHHAALIGDVELVELLLDRNADLMATTKVLATVVAITLNDMFYSI